MSFYVSRGFGKRIGRIERKHRKLARGGVTVLRSDGLMVLRPRRTGFARLLAFALISAAAFCCFKAVVYVADGPISYQARLDRLETGTGPEAMAARLMEIDPLTQTLLTHGEPLILRGLQEWKEFRPSLIAEYWGRV
ncbi:MAG: hypothetical protein AAGH70_08200 [Pseudomonadota bacterium]